MPYPLSERTLYSKNWPTDKRKKVKLIEVVNKQNQKWYYISIGGRLLSRTQSLSTAKERYSYY